jgi:hypothetical protein
MTDLEKTAIDFFRAIRATGKEVLEHDTFGFKLDINVMVPPNDHKLAAVFSSKIQEALTTASRTVQPVTVDGTSLQ